jgi:D-sedoheptulose 7-phosphate isomerase
MADDFITSYLNNLHEAIQELPISDIERVVEVIYQAYQRGSQIFIMGNGGSAATASHFACDLGKGTAAPGKGRFRVMSLNDNVPLMTAYANDFGYEDIFAEQLVNLVQPDDVVIMITASGNSPNILKAAECANEHGAITVGFIGFGGGKLKDMVDYHITISSRDYGNVEDVHLILEHSISAYFRERLTQG